MDFTKVAGQSGSGTNQVGAETVHGSTKGNQYYRFSSEPIINVTRRIQCAGF